MAVLRTDIPLARRRTDRALTLRALVDATSIPCETIQTATFRAATVRERVLSASPSRRKQITFAALLGISLATGCSKPTGGPVVIYLEGASWGASAGSVERGLRDAGYDGRFETFTWTSFLGPAHDHFVNASSGLIAKRLARRIEAHREADGEAPIRVMGLSAGTSLVLMALERLEGGVMVDDVVLFSPTCSARYDLTRPMRHVRGRLYATCSPHDGIASTLIVNADGKSGPPAGLNGFRMPTRAGSTESIDAYGRVFNLPWQSTYVGYDWSGSHTGVSSRRFVQAVIAPRLLSPDPYPLDRSVYEVSGAQAIGASP